MENQSNLLLKLSRSLFADTAEPEKFIHAVTNPQAFHPAILWLQPKPTENPTVIVVGRCQFYWLPQFADSFGSRHGESEPIAGRKKFDREFCNGGKA